MQTTAVQYKLIKKIRDERFDEERLHQYNLLIQIGTHDFQVGVVDNEDNRFLLLEDYVLPNISSHTDQLQVLKQIFDSHAFIRAGFWNQVKVSVKNQKFVQVPKSLFIEEAAADYLQFNAHVNKQNENISHIHHQRADAVTVFALWDELKEWLQGTYPTRRPVFLHQAACLIEGVMNYAETRDDNPLYIYVDRFKLHILSCQKGKLVYYNQFAIKQFSEYIKYIMLVMNSLKMDQHTSQVVLWGYLGKNSPHYHEFYKYISNVTFGVRPPGLQFGYMFDEAQDHHFFDLYSMHLAG